MQTKYLHFRHFYLFEIAATSCQYIRKYIAIYLNCKENDIQASYWMLSSTLHTIYMDMYIYFQQFKMKWQKEVLWHIYNQWKVITINNS